MQFVEIIKRAVNVRRKYSNLEKKLYGEEWSREEIALGFVTDVGELMELVVANEGKRDIEDSEDKLAHELSDCLWSIIILADKYDVDLEKVFMGNMNVLEKKIVKRLGE